MNETLRTYWLKKKKGGKRKKKQLPYRYTDRQRDATAERTY